MTPDSINEGNTGGEFQAKSQEICNFTLNPPITSSCVNEARKTIGLPLDTPSSQRDAHSRSLGLEMRDNRLKLGEIYFDEESVSPGNLSRAPGKEEFGNEDLDLENESYLDVLLSAFRGGLPMALVASQNTEVDS